MNSSVAAVTSFKLPEHNFVRVLKVNVRELDTLVILSCSSYIAYIRYQMFVRYLLECSANLPWVPSLP